VAPTIEQEILIDAPVDVVWRTVTEPEQVRLWFADEADLQAEAGYEGSLTFTDEATNTSRSFQVTVQSVEPARSFSYRWQHPQRVEAGDGNSTLVEFTLTPEGDGTRLRVVETGVERMGWSQEQQDTFAEQHTRGWATYLARLRDLVGRQRADQAP
jgi:uncharacterized protein YndB with AHSA1/START domain